MLTFPEDRSRGGCRNATLYLQIIRWTKSTKKKKENSFSTDRAIRLSRCKVVSTPNDKAHEVLKLSLQLIALSIKIRGIFFYLRVLKDILRTQASESKNKDASVDWREPHSYIEYSSTDMVSSVSIVTLPQVVRPTNHSFISIQP